MGVSVFVTPVYLNCTKFLDGNIQAKDDAEGGDNVCLVLKSFSASTDGDEVIREASVFCGVKEVIRASNVQRSTVYCGEGTKEDVKEAIPVEWRGNIPLSCSNLCLKAWGFLVIVQ